MESFATSLDAAQPKYTGCNVWNRHDKRRGRPLIRPREQWIWSATPTHEAIISRTVRHGRRPRAAQQDPLDAIMEFLGERIFGPPSIPSSRSRPGGSKN